MARIIRHLAKLGWTPVDLYNGDDEPVDLAGICVEEVVQECRATDECHLRIGKADMHGTIFLVWGNSPVELIADHNAHANGAWFGWQAGAASIEAKAAPVGEREAFEAWLGITPCGAAHDLAVKAFQAGAAYQRQSGVEMPEYQDAEGLLHPFMKDRAIGWNACLNEFERLNGAGSHE